MPRSLLLDFNGVIINDEEQHRESLTATLGGYGISLSREGYYAEYLGFDDRECFRHAFRTAGLSTGAAVISEAVAGKGRAYQALISERMDLVPGSIAFIEAAFRDGISMGIVSAARREEIEFVLKTAAVRDLVDVIVAAEDVTTCKPSPEGYLYGLDLLGADPATALAVEDSIPGMQAARAAGLGVVMLATSHPVAKLRKAGAEVVWEHFEGRAPQELPWS
ncbi:MAG TPA: HAD family phosphatase [Gemmatimonadales bacterium]|nr:HAD family phosphatase [Gemmatimonadales bacterium]